MRFRQTMTIFGLTAVLAGCADDRTWKNQQAELWQQRESGKISPAEYETALKKLRRSQPWGGVEPAPPPIVDYLSATNSDDHTEQTQRHR